MPPKKHDPLEILNLYEKLGVDNEQPTYKLQDDMKITLPFNLNINGATGSKKTNLMLNTIQMMNKWSNILAFVKNQNQPLYEKFIPAFENAGGTITVSSDLADLPNIEDVEDPKNTLVIFDDMLAERNLKQVEDYFLRARNHGISLMFISQKHMGKGGTPMMIRENSHYLFVKRPTREKGLKLMLEDYGLPKYALELHRIATAKSEDFLMIDMRTSDPKLRMRHNFKPFPDELIAKLKAEEK
jgi:hypothetical protein